MKISTKPTTYATVLQLSTKCHPNTAETFCLKLITIYEVQFMYHQIGVLNKKISDILTISEISFDDCLAGGDSLGLFEKPHTGLPSSQLVQEVKLWIQAPARVMMMTYQNVRCPQLETQDNSPDGGVTKRL